MIKIRYLILAFVSLISTGAVTANTLYTATNYNSEADSSLYTIDDSTGAATLIGSTGVTLTDIAFSGSTLYGVTYNDFYTVNPETGMSTLVGSTGYSGVNTLDVDKDGTIYSADFLTRELLTINPATGAATVVGSFGSFGSSGLFGFGGGLAFGQDGTLYGTFYCGVGDCLAIIDPLSGNATKVGDINNTYVGIFGLEFKQDILYGVSPTGQVLTIDTSTGAGTLVGTNDLEQWGLTISSVPIPAAVWLFGSGLLGLIGVARRKKA